MRRSVLLLAMTVFLGTTTAFLGCRRSEPPSPSTSTSASSATGLHASASATSSSSAFPVPSSAPPSLGLLVPSEDAGARVRPHVTAATRAGDRAKIPGGTFVAGSTPGDEGRDPRTEPTSLSVTLSPYEIDLLPYPNDPAAPPRVDVPQKEAARLCKERGQRLCTELEWESACRGDAGDTYPTGSAWDRTCAREPATCRSSSGTLAMSTLREWTASDVMPLEKDDRALPAVRGAAESAPATDHRCAHRAAVAPATHARDLGFRCCSGSPNGAIVPSPKLGPTARKIALEPSAVAEIFARVPELASLGSSIRYFNEPDDTAIVLKRGRTASGPADPEGFTLTTSPLLWNPAPGEEVLVVLGHGAKDSFIVALYRLPDNRYRLASSFILAGDLGPFALAYHPEVRERLLWSACWKCTGEGGTVSLRDGRRVIIVQQ